MTAESVVIDLDAIESRAAWAGSYSTDGVQAAAERFRIARVDVPALLARVRASEAERDQARATVTRLNRRAQEAESKVARSEALAARVGSIEQVRKFLADQGVDGLQELADRSRTVETAESLLDTRAGLALANAAWGEGAHATIAEVNRHQDQGGPYSRPVNPYSVAHLARIKADAAKPVPSTPEETDSEEVRRLGAKIIAREKPILDRLAEHDGPEEEAQRSAALAQFVAEGLTTRQALNAFHGFPLDWTPPAPEEDNTSRECGNDSHHGYGTGYCGDCTKEAALP